GPPALAGDPPGACPGRETGSGPRIHDSPPAADSRHRSNCLRAHYPRGRLPAAVRKALCTRAVRRRDARGEPPGHALGARRKPVPPRRASPPAEREGLRHAGGAVGDRQPGEGRLRPGGAEHEPDVRSSGDGGPHSGSGGAVKSWTKALRRWLGIAALLGISAASAAWIYDAGRRFAGFDRSEVQEELSRVSRELDTARSELERLRA